MQYICFNISKFIYMSKNDRQQLLLKKLSEKKKIATADLAIFFNVSKDTIRRDLITLNKKGLIYKEYGGAALVSKATENLFEIEITNKEAKVRIAKKAVSLLGYGQKILITGGTTNLAFAKLFPPNLVATVYTYSLPIAMQLAKHNNIDLIFIGGKLQKNAMVTTGIDVVKVLSSIKIDICFIGVSSINLEHGLTELGYEVSIVKKTIIKNSRQVIAMVTANKLNTENPHEVCSLSEINTVITDLSPSDKRLEAYARKGIKLM